jgi:hypothetical protein
MPTKASDCQHIKASELYKLGKNKKPFVKPTQAAA